MLKQIQINSLHQKKSEKRFKNPENLQYCQQNSDIKYSKNN